MHRSAGCHGCGKLAEARGSCTSIINRVHVHRKQLRFAWRMLRSTVPEGYTSAGGSPNRQFQFWVMLSSQLLVNNLCCATTEVHAACLLHLRCGFGAVCVLVCRASAFIQRHPQFVWGGIVVRYGALSRSDLQAGSALLLIGRTSAGAAHWLPCPWAPLLTST